MFLQIVKAYSLRHQLFDLKLFSNWNQHFCVLKTDVKGEGYRMFTVCRPVIVKF